MTGNGNYWNLLKLVGEKKTREITYCIRWVDDEMPQGETESVIASLYDNLSWRSGTEDRTG